MERYAEGQHKRKDAVSMRYGTPVVFVKENEKHYDPDSGEWIKSETVRVKKYANVTHMRSPSEGDPRLRSCGPPLGNRHSVWYPAHARVPSGRRRNFNGLAARNISPLELVPEPRRT